MLADFNASPSLNRLIEVLNNATLEILSYCNEVNTNNTLQSCTNMLSLSQERYLPSLLSLGDNSGVRRILQTLGDPVFLQDNETNLFDSYLRDLVSECMTENTFLTVYSLCMFM